MIRAYTGPSDLTREQRVFVALRLLEQTPYIDEVWRSGCAYGVDTIVARLAVVLEFEVDLELFVPCGNHNGTMVHELAVKATDVFRIQKYKGTTSHQFRKRNRAMVLGESVGRPRADHLLAFVKSRKFYRSGEWMTINIAKSAGISFTVVELP